MSSIVKNFEEAVIKDIKKITNYSGIKWDAVFLNGGDIDFHDEEIEITFLVGNYNGERYKFWYDYEMKRGALYKIEVKNNEENMIALWKKGLFE